MNSTSSPTASSELLLSPLRPSAPIARSMIACMVIIRLAAFLEREEYVPYMDALTPPEKRALRTTRNIAAHSGYQSMDDQLLWTAVTRNVPDMIVRLRATASRG